MLRYQEIEQELRQYIRQNRLVAHDLMPSESRLMQHFGCSVHTLRKAFDVLLRAGVIYKRHGKGTFVSPARFKMPVLLVSHYQTMEDLYSGEDRGGFWGFFRGAQRASVMGDLPYEPVALGCDRFEQMLPDLQLMYPALAGVIFFRGHNWLMRCRALLGQQRIPFMFYGPDVYDDLAGVNCLFHDETAIAETVARHLAARGYRRIARLTAEREVLCMRTAVFDRVAPRFGLEVRPEDRFTSWEHNPDFPAIIRRCEVINAFSDYYCVQLLNYLKEERGYGIPADIGLIGITNSLLSTMCRPQLTTVELDEVVSGELALRSFAKYLETPDAPFTEYAPFRLIARDSC